MNEQRSQMLSSLRLWCVGIACLLLLAAWATKTLEMNKNNDYSAEVVLNDFTNDGITLNQLLLEARQGRLQNYDNISLTLNDMLANYQRLTQIISGTTFPMSDMIDLKINDLGMRMDDIERVVQALKSDIAATRNSTNYLPNLLMESFYLSSNPNTEEFREAHRNLTRLLTNKYKNNLYKFQNYEKDLDIIRSSGDQRLSEHVDNITKHIKVINTYQQRILENFQALEQIDILSDAHALMAVFVKQHEDLDHAQDQISHALQLFVLVLLIVILFNFLRIKSQRNLLKIENQHSRRVNTALTTLAQFTNKDEQSDYFDACMKCVVEASECDIAYVAFFDQDRDDYLCTASVWSREGKQEDFSYPLNGAPCEDVIQNSSCYVERGVADRYPEDPMLSDEGLQAYFGQALLDRENKHIGVLTFMYRKPTIAEAWLQALLDIFATRISIELERSQALKALSRQKEEALVTLNAIADGVIRADDTGVITAVNPAANKMLAIAEDSDGFRPHINNIFQQDSGGGNEFTRQIDNCLKTRKTYVRNKQVTLTTRKGNTLFVQLSIAPILDSSNEVSGVVAVLHDVRHELEYRNELAFQASHDSLTGVLNRRALESEIETLLKNFPENDSCALMFIDLDRFKIVNDTCGHSAGDALLKDFAELLREQIRESDKLARLGGDEFFIVLTGCSLDSAKRIANNILEQTKALRFFWQSNEFQLSASIGMTIIETPEHNFTELMSTVDQACLQSKNLGRNRLHISYPDDSEVSDRKQERLWVPRLNNALEQDHFVLYQQAIIQANSAAAKKQSDDDADHIEILIRMRDPSGKLIMPNEFLSAAERYDVMTRIDRWVISNVMSRMSGKYKLANLVDKQFVAINLSGQSLADETLLDFIVAEMTRFDIAPERLCFEVTETAAIANYTNAVTLVKELKAAGCSFSLDDFGSGLSSYGYIKNLPADYLKIDREFSRELIDDNINQAIIQSVIDVAHNIGMKAIAEGIEDQQTQDIVESYGVDYMQGYWFEMPHPIDIDEDYNITATSA